MENMNFVDAAPTQAVLHASPYLWPDAKSLPRREWLFGNWLLKGEVTAIIAPGGTGKSTISNAIALSLASGKPLLGKPLHRGAQGVWIFNLEDGPDELNRQIAATCSFHGISRSDCGERLHLDSGIIQPLCTAIDDRDGFELHEEVFTQLAETIVQRGIATLIVDPFISSHAVSENSNEAINALVKRWKKLAHDTGCAIVLIHHVKKLGGREATAEDGRGAVALRDAARVVLPLNQMSKEDAKGFGVSAEQRRSLVRIDVGKANRGPSGEEIWIKLEGQSLGNASANELSDFVGVATLWEKPDLFREMSVWHLYDVQQRLAKEEWRDSPNADRWVGNLVAEVAGLSMEIDKPRINAILQAWRESGAVLKESRRLNGRDVPFAVVGDALDPSELGPRPQSNNCGAEAAGSAARDPI